MKVSPGSVLAGRFELRRRAGRGGMGSVYQARDQTTGKDVAIKILGLTGNDDITRFIREANMLATVVHPHVVGYVTHGEIEGMHYIVEDWAEGVSLSSRLRAQGVTPREAIAIATDLADALGAVHAADMIHRDVKPSNVILTDTGAKLVDFGIARRATEGGSLTRTGAMVGTPQYMAPEQARGDTKLAPACDVWSLGCLIYEMLGGKSPFVGESATAIRAKVLLVDPPPLVTVFPGSSPALTALVTEMLAKAAASRPPDGAAVAARLRALPQLPDGPSRMIESASPTAVMPVGPKRQTPTGCENCFVLVTPLEGATGEYGPKLAEVASSRGLDVHLLDDGSALLASKEQGKTAALAASRAAIDLRSENWDAAITVFGKAYDDLLVDAIDRGSALLERAQIDTLFGAQGGVASIPIDDVIAELVSEELDVEQGDDGPLLRSRVA